MIGTVSVYCLSFHAGYACRHSGACCTAAWDIATEPAVLHAVRAGVVALRESPGEPLFVAVEPTNQGSATIVGKHRDGSCVFFERDHLCAIHRQAGPDVLPSACRMFPRVVLRDARGAFVTLSHFCPTAAALLLHPGPFRIVEAPPALGFGGALEGLDATSVLPPLLRPGLLMDYDGYSVWEHAGIDVLDRHDLSADAALDTIAAATRDVMGWTPRQGPLSERVQTAFASAVRHARTPTPVTRDEGRALRAYLAAHLFGNWAAYQGGGLFAVVDWLHTAIGTLRSELASRGSFIEAAGAADLRLRHSAR
jgi:Fe-S-cluster containining protein